MAGKVFEKEYEIHYYEIDIHKKALITSLVDYMCDAATRQSEELGIGIDYLMENNLGWVLYKWNINIDEYPKYGDKIIIRTWPYSFRKFYAYRKFEILDCNMNLIGNADTIWFLLNTERRRPVRVNEKIYTTYGVELDNEKSIEIDALSAPNKIDYEKIFNVRYSDIDTNNHVNNSKYIAWAIETVPVDIILNSELKNLSVVYEKETTYGDTVNVLTESVNNVDKIIYNHKIVDKNNKELTLIRTCWSKI